MPFVYFHGPVREAAQLAVELRSKGIEVMYPAPQDTKRADHEVFHVMMRVSGEPTAPNLDVLREAVAEFRFEHLGVLADVHET